MESYRADLHIHSYHTPATADNLTLDNLTEYASLKGIDILGTGDCLLPEWRDKLYENLEREEGLYEFNGTYFVPSVEIKDEDAVHHLIYTETLDDFGELRDRWKDHSKINKVGVPTINLNGEEIIDDVEDVGGVIGPAHIFIQWQSLYKSFDSIKESYGDNTDKVHFYELGLTAADSMTDEISELDGLSQMTNSDLHSVQKMGREFNEFRIEEPTFEEFVKALKKEDGREISRNVGMPAEIGKHFLTACKDCGAKYRLEDAISVNWKCEQDSGKIVKGVKDRVGELSNGDFYVGETDSYTEIPPLEKILEWSGYNTREKRMEIWRKLVEEIDEEIEILLNSDLDNVREMEPEVADWIKKARKDRIDYIPGGGNHEGQPDDGESWSFQDINQTSFDDFY
jgi:uncharacterized protein (TIGR00375 family)